MNDTTAYAITDGRGWYWWTFQPTREQAISHFAGDQGYEKNRAEWARAQAGGHRCVRVELRVMEEQQEMGL